MKRMIKALSKPNTLKAAAVLLAILIAAGLVFGNIQVLAEGEELPYDGEFGPCEIVKSRKGVSFYPASKLKVLTADEAAEAGVPEGYKGHVLSLGEGESIGATFDFTGCGINVYSIRSIVIRFYVESTPEDITEGDTRYPEIRIPYPKLTDTWVTRYDVSSKTDKWTALSIYPDGTNITTQAKNVKNSDNALMCIADEDGFLEAFEVFVRRHGGRGAFYIDSITINRDYNDRKGPDITYNDEDSIKLPKGSEIILDVSAYDYIEQRNTPVKFKWEDGTVLEEDGYPAIGTKAALIVYSADGFGNTSEIRINAEVVPEDKVPPDITFKTDKFKAVAGTIPQIRGTVTDNIRVVNVEYEWQEGALDGLGRLNTGTFELKISARDSSGNVAEKTVTVTAGGPEMLAGVTVTDDIAK